MMCTVTHNNSALSHVFPTPGDIGFILKEVWHGSTFFVVGGHFK